MNSKHPPTTKDVRRHLRDLLPERAFAAAPSRLLWLIPHLIIVAASCFALRIGSAFWVGALAMVATGHSFLCIGFLMHDYSHGTIVRGPLRYPLEALFWSLCVTSATVWQVNHNQTHHRELSTPRDSFRYFSENERSSARFMYALLFLPNRHLPWFPLQGLTYLMQMTGHTVCALLGLHGERVGFLTGVRPYSPRQRLRVAGETLLALGFQLAIFYGCGGTFERYVWVGPGALVVGSFIASAYLYTQHTLHPLVEQENPLVTTSVHVPKVLNWLHFNMSHHTAHHLLESVASSHLPEVTALLRRHYPEVLHMETFWGSLRRAQQNPLYKLSPSSSAESELGQAAPGT